MKKIKPTTKRIQDTNKEYFCVFILNKIIKFEYFASMFYWLLLFFIALISIKIITKY